MYYIIFPRHKIQYK